MALIINIDVNQANTNVKALGDNIVQLGDKAHEAGQKIKSNLDFGQMAKSEINALRQSFKDLESMTLGVASALKKQAGILGEVRQNKRKYIEEVQKSSKAILDETKALQKVADSTAKATAADKAKAKAVREAVTEVQKYVTALDTQNVKMTASSQKLMTLKSGWKEMTDEQRKAATHMLKVNQAMSATASLVARQISPLEQYRKNLKNLDIARKEFLATNGRVGISDLQYRRGLQAANVLLAEHAKKNAHAGKSLRDLAVSSGLAAQSAAGFRAILSGSNASFGIFTGSTILTATAMFALTRAVASTISAGATFERSFERSAAIMKEFKNVAEEGAPALYKFTAAGKLVRDEVIRLGQETQYSAEQVSEAVRYLAASGYTAAEVMNSLEAVVTLGAVAFIELDKAADMAANILRSFGKQSGDLMHIVNMMAVAVNESNVNMEQMAKSMVYVGPAANAAGVSIEQTTAAIAVLANVGIKGSMAGTALRRIIVSLAEPSKKASETLARLGVEVAKTDTGGVDLVKTFERLNRAGVQLGELKTMFGLWPLSAAVAMTQVSKGTDEATNAFLRFENKLKNVKDEAIQMRQAMQDNVLMSLERVQSSFNAIQIKAFESLGPNIKEILDKVDAALDGNANEIAEWIAKVGTGLAKGVLFVIDNFKTITNFLLGWSLAKIVGGIVTSVIAAWAKLGPLFTATLAAYKTEKAAVDALTASNNMLAAAKRHAAAIPTGGVGGTGGGVGPVVLGSGKPVPDIPKDLTKNLGAAGKAAGFAATAMTVLRGSLAALWTTLRAGFALFGGLAGILLTIAGYLIVDYVTAADTAATATDDLNSTLDKFNLTLENNAQVLNTMSRDALINMRNELNTTKQAAIQDIQEIDTNIARLKKLRDAANKEPVKPDRMASGTDSAFRNIFPAYGAAQMALEALAARQLASANSDLAEAEKSRAGTLNSISQATKGVELVTGALAVTTKNNTNTVVESKAAYAEYDGALKELHQRKTDEASLVGLTGMAYWRAKVALDAYEGGIKTNTESLDFQVKQQQELVDVTSKSSAAYGGAKAVLDNLIAVREKEIQYQRELKIEELASLLYADEKNAKSKRAVENYKTESEQLSQLALKLRDLNNFQAQVVSEGTALIGYLKTLGISAESAQNALNIKTDEMRLDYLSAVLAELDPRFKSLADSIRKTTESAFSFDEIMLIVADVLSKSGLAGADLDAELKRLTPTIRGMADGTADANKKADDLIKSVEEEIAKFGILEYTVEGVTAAFGKMDPERAKHLSYLLKLKAAMSTFDPILQGMKSDTKKSAEAQELLNTLIGKFPQYADQATAAMQRWSEANTGIGKVQLQMRQDAGQMDAMLAGGTANLEIYNRLWDLTGGHIEDASEELKALVKQEAYLKDMQVAVTDFYQGVEGSIKDVFNGTLKSAEDVFDRLKDLFKNLLIDMAMAAVKNKIVLNISGGMSGGGGGGNFWGNLASNFFGGGGGGGIATSAVGTAGAGPLASGFVYGGGAPWMAGMPAAGYGGYVGAAGSTGAVGLAGMYQGIGQTLSGIGSSIGGMFGLGGSYAGVAATPIGSVGPMAGGYAYPAAAGGAPAGSALGGFGTALAGIGGAMYGWQRAGGGISGAHAAGAYGALGIGIAGTAAGLAGGATLGAAAGGAFGAFGAATAIPVVGWILAALALIDAVSGGKLFGTKYRAKSVTQGINLNELGGTASTELFETRQGALFSGIRRRTRTIDSSPEAIKAAEELFEQISDVIKDAARKLGVETPAMFDAAIRTVQELDKKGKVKSTKIFVDILGRSWEEETEELAVKRLNAEALIMTLDESLKASESTAAQMIAKTVNNSMAKSLNQIGGPSLADNLGGALNGPLGVMSPDGQVGGYSEGGGGMTPDTGRGAGQLPANAGEASRIAERWRDNAELLLDGATMLVTAQLAANSGAFLLTKDSSLTQVADLVEDLQNGGESLTDTFIRLMANTDSFRNALERINVDMGLSAEETVRMATDIADSAGGLENANALWEGFYTRFYDSAVQSNMAFDNLIDSRNSQLADLGLSPTISKDEFAEIFTSRLPELNADEIVDYLRAANAVADVFDAMTAITNNLTSQIANLVSTANTGGAIISLTDKQFANFIAGIGETIDKLRAYGGQEAVDNFRTSFESSLDSQLGWRQYVLQLRAVDRQFQANMETARLLGSSMLTLVKIEQYAIAQRLRIMNELSDGIRDMVTQLRDMDKADADRAAAALIDQDALDAAEEARKIAYDYWESAQAATQAAIEAQNALFQAAQAAITEITDFLNQININDMSPASLEDRLGESRRQFDDLLTRALGGDMDAASQLTQTASEYLGLGQEYYGSTTGYAEIFRYVNQMLATIKAQLGMIGDGGTFSPGENPYEPVDAPDVRDPAAIWTAADEERARRSRFELALGIAQRIGELHIITGTDVDALATSFGTSIEELATNLGINLEELDSNTVNNLVLLAAALGVTTMSIVDALEINISDLAESFGVDLTAMTEANFTKISELASMLGANSLELAEQLGFDLAAIAATFHIDTIALGQSTVDGLAAMATTFGVGIFDLMTALGVNIVDLATSIGINFQELNAENWTAFVTFANQLGTDIVTLATSLGGTIDQIGDLIADTVTRGLTDLPALPQDILDNLGPLLTAIREADTTSEINDAMQDLRNYTDTLPEDQRNMLKPVLDSLLGAGGVGGDLGAVRATIEEIGEDQLAVQNNISECLITVDSKLGEGNILLTSMTTYLQEMRDMMSLDAAKMAAADDPIAKAFADEGGSAESRAAAIEAGVAAAQVVTANVQVLQATADTKNEAALLEVVDATERTADNVGKVEDAIALLTRIVADQQAQIIKLNQQIADDTNKARKSKGMNQIPNMTNKRKK